MNKFCCKVSFSLICNLLNIIAHRILKITIEKIVLEYVFDPREPLDLQNPKMFSF